jgi:6-pyruvoyltetrahydropterin/6-carboxytetrahydropterin synthase
MRIIRVERIEAARAEGDGRVRVLAFDLEAAIDGPVDPGSGMVVNLTDMKRTLRERVTRAWSGRFLDGRGGVPDAATPEHLARAVWDELGGRLAELPLAFVRLADRGSPVVEYRGEEAMDVTRMYEFSASHRLHSPALSDDENVAVFGKCNNPAGHGHNYVLEVTMRGVPGGGGEVIAGAELDRIVHEQVVDRWDHRHLNADLPEFERVNPTAEEIARLAWQRIERGLAELPGGARLHRVKLRETERNHVEYFGD